MSLLQVVQGSIGGRVTINVTSGGVPLDLTNFDVYARFSIKDSTTALWERQCVLLTPYDDGVAEYTWQSGDLDTPGMYEMEVEVRSFDTLVNVTSPDIIDIQVMQRMTVPD